MIFYIKSDILFKINITYNSIMSIANLFTPNAYDLFSGSITPGIIKDSSGNAGASGKILASNGSNLTWSNLSVNMSNISGFNIGTPSSGQVLVYDGSNFVNQTTKDQISFNSALTIISGSYIGQSGIISSYNGAASLTSENIVFTKIGGRLSTDPLIGSVTFTLYVNGVATALNVVVGAGSTTGSNTGSISVAAGSTYAIRCSVTGLATLSVAQVSLTYNY